MPFDLQQFLPKPFIKDEFIKFCKYFLPDKFKPETETISVEHFAPELIQEAEYVGGVNSRDLELSVFIIKHSGTRDPRVRLTKEIQKLMKGYNLPNALVALHSDRTGEWRLSLVTNTIQEGFKNEFSNPKRFSYVLGPGAKTSTAKRQLKNPVSTLEGLKKAFSLEVVTKEFYDSLKNLYEKLYKNLSLPTQNNPTEADRKDFALRLIGRLIFCWFLKEKGWIGQDILSRKAAKKYKANGNYYLTTLEPLFFKTLNLEPENRDYDLGTNESLQKNHSQIPYLNDGLFEPKKTDYYDSKHKTIPGDELVEILNLFETYHFTIDENTSTEQELGVDPEMMGRIFENFILNRSETGSFYTPREVVDYMVETSLKEYLKSQGIALNQVDNLFETKYWSPTEKFTTEMVPEILSKLDSLKTIDPACGSGAFPMGVLQKLVDIYHYLGETNTYQVKKRILENSIYGVDILPIAVEISRLRCWLSLVVDEDKNQPEPLPNLEFKFVCANSLVGIREAAGLEDPEVEGLRKGLGEIRKKTFVPGSNKAELKKKWKTTAGKLFKLQLESGFYDQNATDLASWNPFTNQAADFFDPEWMFGLEQFDLVIGNPPYIQLQKNEGELGNLYKDAGYETFAKTGDIYQLFYERGWQLLKDRGILTFITSNKWMRAGYGKSTRKFFVEKANPLILLDLGPNVFETATVDTNILVFSKAANQGKTKAELNKLTREAETINFSSDDGWFIGTPAETALKKKIEQVGKPLKDWDVQINYGIKTGLNEAFIIDQAKRDELVAEDPKAPR